MDRPPLTSENALTLVAELEDLVRTRRRDDVNEEAAETAERIVSSLATAPGPRDVIDEKLRAIRAWTAVMFRDAKHAGPGPVKDLVLSDIFDLRTAIEQPAMEASREPEAETG